jgi:HD-GYP domain-containing protein (c-di-GMP phosphodiesterase class II)
MKPKTGSASTVSLRRRGTLRFRLLAVYIPVLVLVLLTLFAGMEWRANRQAMAALEQRLEIFVSTNAPVLAAPMWVYDDGLTDSLVSVMSGHPDLLAIEVRNTFGDVVAAHGPVEALDRDSSVLTRSVPIIKREIDGSTVVGDLRVAFDDSRVRQALSRSITTDAITIGVVLVVLIALVVITTGRLVFRPLDRLYRAMCIDPELGQPRRVEHESPDEFGAVCDAFNAMERRRADLQGSHARLIDLGILMGSEHNPKRLTETILEAACDLCHSDGGTLYLLNEDEDRLEFAIIINRSLGIRLGGAEGDPISFKPLPLHLPDGQPNNANVAVHAALTKVGVNIPDVYNTEAFDFTGPQAFDAANTYRTTSLLAVPLTNRQNDVIGVLQLINASDPETGRVVAFDPPRASIARALGAQAGVALENQLLLEAQRHLLDSFIELMAGAIDAKSPYTGGHCSRVPEITRLLTEAACADTETFPDFNLTEAEWYELHIASWLHDCGKVTSPEYVIDKATKLETIANRIHEIRTRFEVLWRDAEIAECRALLAGADPETARRDREQAQAALQDDFAFVATCNIGGEFMDDGRIDRLKTIGARTWTRHFDNRLGLSLGEEQRLAGVPPSPPPSEERLLDDKPEHIVPWPNNVPPVTADNPYGFTMTAPDRQFNFGELYNLSVRRGTLTEEERFKINDHMIQTIMMLESLPLPKHLRRVPEYAGGHHEKMDGKGYPRGIMGATMSIPARIMAIADIFEALTAADRPYKTPKTVSEALKIMSFMRNDKHIDANLFDLFLRSGVWRTYAETHLRPEQIDAVDINLYKSSASG